MTQHLLTIFNEIDFKLRMIAHFKKVHDKAVDDPSMRKLMIDQTIRQDDAVWDMVTANKELNKKVGRLEKKYKLKEWFMLCDKTREVKDV